ncbi:hypothetical protein [Nocardiopsis halophila]|uniref:hypothetical protein n=1 Tax=Nocardiopsis halophila TaxID=141692 RepID=UPI00034CEE81|nr:hypothetical protein [Nocardiopsis halophila]
MPATALPLTPDHLDHLLSAPQEATLLADAGRVRLRQGRLLETPRRVLATRTEAYGLMGPERTGRMDRPAALAQAADILNAYNRQLARHRPGRAVVFGTAPVRHTTCGSSIGLVVCDPAGRILATDARWDVRAPEARHADPSTDLGRLVTATAEQSGLEITLRPRFAQRAATDACDGPRWMPAPPGYMHHQHDWYLFHATAAGAPAPGWRWYTPGELAALGHRTWLHRRGQRRHPGLDAAWIGHLSGSGGGHVVTAAAREDLEAGGCAHLGTAAT